MRIVHLGGQEACSLAGQFKKLGWTSLYLGEALSAERAEEIVERLGALLGGQVADCDEDGLDAEVHVVVLNVLLQLQHGLEAGQLPSWLTEKIWFFWPVCIPDFSTFCADPYRWSKDSDPDPETYLFFSRFQEAINLFFISVLNDKTDINVPPVSKMQKIRNKHDFYYLESHRRKE